MALEKIIITGSAGFIGSALSKKLLEKGYKVIGIDNHNNYYSKKLKNDRILRYKNNKNYIHVREDICEKKKDISII